MNDKIKTVFDYKGEFINIDVDSLIKWINSASLDVKSRIKSEIKIDSLQINRLICHIL